jgi:amidase
VTQVVVKREKLRYEFGRGFEPVAYVESGQQILVETEDAFNGRLRASEDVHQLLGPDALPPNPLTGPFYIQGANPGDTLVVCIDAIELDEQGAICYITTSGRAIDTWFDKPLAMVVPIQNDYLIFSPSLKVRTQPFIGCVGTAPAYGSPQSIETYRGGGNMDCALVIPGTRVFLPVSVAGAYFYIGDVHALQADSEYCGTAVETRSTIKLHFEVISGPSEGLNWPRVETPDSLVTIVGGQPLDDCLRLVYQEMLRWLEIEYGLDPAETFLKLSQLANARLCNWFTVRCEMPKAYLPL